MGTTLDDRLKTFYTGTQKELKEKIPGGFNGFSLLWIAEGVIAFSTLFKAIDGRFDTLSAMGMPLTIDYFSRLYKCVRQKCTEYPHHTPNLIGMIREYKEKKKE